MEVGNRGYRLSHQSKSAIARLIRGCNSIGEDRSGMDKLSSASRVLIRRGYKAREMCVPAIGLSKGAALGVR
jgi:hypothetical protein